MAKLKSLQWVEVLGLEVRPLGRVYCVPKDENPYDSTGRQRNMLFVTLDIPKGKYVPVNELRAALDEIERVRFAEENQPAGEL